MEFAQGVEFGGGELEAFFAGTEDGLDFTLAVAISVLGEFALLVGKRQQRVVDLADQARPFGHLGSCGFGFEADRVAELVMAIEAIDTTVPE